MAPPSPRRPGFSRRAQYSIFATYVVAVIGAILALLLVVTARLDPQGNAALQSLLTDMTSPLSRAGRSVLAGLHSIDDTVANYFRAASKNKVMTEELKAARRDLIQGKVDAIENRRLKRLLGLRETEKILTVAARLVASTSSGSRRYATLAAGRIQGIEVDQPARTIDGLVGRIVQTGQVSSRVLMIIDAQNIVPVKRVTDNVPAQAIGIGDGRLELRPLAAGTNPFKLGDVFVTSGTGGIYRPGIPVAMITRRRGTVTTGRPLADPATYDFVLVEPAAVLPPPPPANEIPQEGD
jgi:rod shape-determining protein MreC